MIHVGFNLYAWGAEHQRQVLVKWLGPLARRLAAEGLSQRFFFTPFDARGPHLFGLFSTSAAEAEGLEERLRSELACCLEAIPNHDSLDLEVVAERHRQCRGKQLCMVDSLPDIADNNSFVVFRQSPDGFPFAATAGLGGVSEIWDHMDEVARWSIDQLADGTGTLAAVRWMAAVDRALLGLGVAAGDFWCYYATTLLLPLSQRLREDEEAVLALLPQLVGEANRATFSRVWDDGEVTTTMPGAEALVRLVAHGAVGERRWIALHHICHVVRGQLAVPVRLVLPLVLFAWLRNLSISPIA